MMNEKINIEIKGALDLEDWKYSAREYFFQGLQNAASDSDFPIHLMIGLAQNEMPKEVLPVGNHFLWLSKQSASKVPLLDWSLLKIRLQHLLEKLNVPKSVCVAASLGEKINMQEKERKSANRSTDEESVNIEWDAINPLFHRSQWIVSSGIAQKLDDALNVIKNQKRIYEQWGFAEVDPHTRAVVCFYGAPGTGKSMAAHVLASELGCPIICASYAQIESKFMGQSPKRLRSVFAAAKAKQAVLFFDEADSFLGKRIENVSQSADQAVNSLRGEMLILLEAFDGVVVFATNLHSNFDKAFDSRVLTHIQFELPNEEAREAIIRSKIPHKAPLAADVDAALFKQLSILSEGFSGRELKNAVFMGLVKAAARAERESDDKVYAAELLASFEEMKKTRESIELDRSAHSQGIKVRPEAQSQLLDAVKEKLSTGKDQSVCQ